MKDKKFLRWIHARLALIHKDDYNADHMHRLRAIIEGYDENKETPNICSKPNQAAMRIDCD